jgi:Acyl-protein synthetase, LuxE
MLSVADIFPENMGSYDLDQPSKLRYLLPRLNTLIRHHHANCPEFANIVDRMFGGLPAHDYGKLEELPFLPVRLFKQRDLRSILSKDVFKVLTSSGTTGQKASKVFLDRTTADLQARALVKIMQHFLGKERLPMVIIDHPGVVRDRASFSARGAGILGLMQFGRQPIYALKDDMTLDIEQLCAYLKAHSGEKILFFGFTFMVWQHAIQELQKVGKAFPDNKGILVHSGGWKKLESLKVQAPEFTRQARETLGVHEVRNFYGMVEQVGSVFFENDLHFLHAPVFADVIIRDPATLAPVPRGETGLIQVISVLPQSYPGNSLLTEDLGRIIGGDDPAAGIQGTFFEVLGRAPQSEIRGCSDTYESAR